MTVEEFLAQRAALVAARTSGALKTTFRSGGTERTTEYRSGTDLAAAIAGIDAELAGLAGRRVHTFLPTFTDGF